MLSIPLSSRQLFSRQVLCKQPKNKLPPQKNSWWYNTTLKAQPNELEHWTTRSSLLPYSALPQPYAPTVSQREKWQKWFLVSVQPWGLEASLWHNHMSSFLSPSALPWAIFNPCSLQEFLLRQLPHQQVAFFTGPSKTSGTFGITQYSGSGQTHTFEKIKKKEKKISCFLYNLESSCLRLTFSLSEKFPSSSLSVNNGRKCIWTGNVAAHNSPAEQLHHLEAIPGSSRKREKSHTSCREGNPGTETLDDTSTMPHYSTAAGILVGMLFLSL